MNDLKIELKESALVLIDLQKGITGRQGVPHSTAEVVRNSARLTEKFRAGGGVVVLVNVCFRGDGRDRLAMTVDAPQAFDPKALPADWAELAPELGKAESDILITKRQWGAFYGTELDLQLRRRGVRTIVLGGIATNMGVESTARDAYERGYHQVFVEDAMTTMIPGGHEFVVKNIFPRMGQVRSTDEVVAALAL